MIAPIRQTELVKCRNQVNNIMSIKTKIIRLCVGGSFISHISHGKLTWLIAEIWKIHSL